MNKGNRLKIEIEVLKKAKKIRQMDGFIEKKEKELKTFLFNKEKEPKKPYHKKTKLFFLRPFFWFVFTFFLAFVAIFLSIYLPSF